MKDDICLCLMVVVTILTFIVAPIITFGYAYNRTQACSPIKPDAPCRVMIGSFAGVLWPLYWSTVVMEPKK